MLESTVLRTAIVTLGKAAVEAAIAAPESAVVPAGDKGSGSTGLHIAVAVIKIAIFIVLL